MKRKKNKKKSQQQILKPFGSCTANNINKITLDRNAEDKQINR